MADYGSIKPKPRTMRRFVKFEFALASQRAKKGKRTSHDDALDELLKRAGY